GTAQFHVHLAPGSAIAHDLGLKGHLVLYSDREHDAPLASGGVLVVVQTDHRRKAPAGAGEMHRYLADRVAVETPSIFPVADFHVVVSPPILSDRVVVGVHVQTRLRTGGGGGRRFGW